MPKHRRAEYCVIDKNAFDSPKSDSPSEEPRLIHWLSAGTYRIAVITDYGMMESVSGDPIINLTNSLGLLSKFPHQVALTLPTAQVGALDLRDGVLTKLIDINQTNDFTNLCIAFARNGEIPIHIQEAVRRQAPAVVKQLNSLVEYTTETVEELSALWEQLGKDDVVRINNFLQPSGRTGEHLKQGICSFAHSVQQALSQKTGATLDIEVRSSISFKYALACIAQRLGHMSSGPPKRLSPIKLRNNTIDANYVAYAQIFGGFMSSDERAMRTYRVAKWLEKHLFAIDDPKQRNRTKI